MIDFLEEEVESTENKIARAEVESRGVKEDGKREEVKEMKEENDNMTDRKIQRSRIREMFVSVVKCFTKNQIRGAGSLCNISQSKWLNMNADDQTILEGLEKICAKGFLKARTDWNSFVT